MSQQDRNTKIITIEVKWNKMKVHEGKLKLSRKVWYGPGIEVYVTGTLKGGLFGQAANLAMNYAENMHIAPSSMRTVSRSMSPREEYSRLTTTQESLYKKRMF